MKKIAIGILGILIGFGLMGCMMGCGDTTETASSEETRQEITESTEDTTPLQDTYYAEITIKDYGKITLELDAKTAPITVANFVNLAQEGFYDGLTFHRIINGFMMQGGDPEGTGLGGSGHNIKGEFAMNNVPNNISHVRGVISMARARAMDSASSQFFIVHQDSQYLDGQYAAFGYVIDGMDVVDQVCENTPVLDNNGSVAKENQPIIESIKIIDAPTGIE